ncbi:MAG: hypothetical protein JO011_10940 [Ktedonobacteraceae bacterium]|nr:hypothetical protein [Ktedonobacteraceae bacterium]
MNTPTGSAATEAIWKPVLPTALLWMEAPFPCASTIVGVPSMPTVPGVTGTFSLCKTQVFNTHDGDYTL